MHLIPSNYFSLDCFSSDIIHEIPSNFLFFRVNNASNLSKFFRFITFLNPTHI
jgi:hypothetical protein